METDENTVKWTAMCGNDLTLTCGNEIEITSFQVSCGNRKVNVSLGGNEHSQLT